VLIVALPVHAIAVQMGPQINACHGTPRDVVAQLGSDERVGLSEEAARVSELGRR